MAAGVAVGTLRTAASGGEEADMWRSEGGRGVARARAAVVAAVTVVAGATFMLGGVADAASQCFTDPSGDTRVVEPKGDVVGYCLTVDNVMAVSVQMATPTDPTTDAYWSQPSAAVGVLWFIGTTGPTDAPYFVATDVTGSGVFHFEADGSVTQTCSASSSYNGTRLQVTFPSPCVGSPTQAWVGTVSVYDTTPNDDSDDPFQDVAPDGDSMSGPVASGSSTTPPTTQPPGPTDPVTRIAGADRVSTAVLASQAGFATAGSAGGVVLASADNYPDALVGVPLAAANSGPVLLTPRDTLPDPVFSEIQRVLASGKTVYLLGGTAAIGDGVRARLETAGITVNRLAGSDRYQTAAAVADAVANPAVILEATGRNFPDALAAGSAAGKAGGVVLLTDGPNVPAATAAYVQAHASAARYAIGGVAAQADPQATAVVGANRYETATRVAAQFFSSPSTVGVANGTNYPDALAGGLHALRAGGPLVLTSPTALPAETASYLQANRTTIANGYVYGGTAAVSDATLTAIRQAIT